MLWITLLATASLVLGEVDIITSPTPGNEYVKISGSPQDAANLTEPKVQIKDEGLTGLQHKPYPIKKAEHISLKKDVLSVKATVKDEGLSGVVKKTSGIGVPPLKHIDDSKFDVLPRKNKRDEGGLDFDDDDLPLSDKKLKPSGTSQSSRINVKKGPNGQEYEYEYVYYYYDDDDDSTGSPSTVAPAPPSRGHSEDRSTSRRPVSEPSEEPRTRGELVKQKNVESGQEPPRSRGESDHRGGHRVVEVTEEVEEEPALRRRTDPRTDDRSKNRYTTIERGATGGRGREPVAVTTAEPQQNEVLPSRGSQRTRGRQVEAAIIEDDRLPANTRFPSRGRGSSVATTIPPQTSQPAQTQPSRTRGQGNGATIRRPSLVDSSSFRTHSSDAAPDADLDKNYYRASPVQDTRESDLEEYVQPELVRPTTFVPIQTTTPPSPAPLPEQPEENMPDKAAHDLYAILQQQQEENSVSGIGGSEVDTFSPTEVATTVEPTTVPTTTTTTTTTEAPTTTTTTTTTTPPPPPPPPATGRGRFRGAPGSRARVRPGGAVSTTTTTEAAPQEEEAPRRKFSPSHGGRTPGQVSAYGRRGAGARATTTTAAPAQEEASTARSRASFGGNTGNRYRARKPTATTSAPQEEEATPETTSAATSHSRPTRPRLNVSAATRPLRPGPRINLRGRGGISTPAPTPAPVPVEEEPSQAPVTSPPPAAPVDEEEASPSPVAPSDALSRLRNRPRLKVIPRQPGAPSASSPRPLPQGFRRPGRPLSQQATPAPEEPVPAPTEPAPAQTEAPAQVADPAPTEPPPPPHLARRRPAIRRLQIPHHQ